MPRRTLRTAVGSPAPYYSYGSLREYTVDRHELREKVPNRHADCFVGAAPDANLFLAGTFLLERPGNEANPKGPRDKMHESVRMANFGIL